MNLLTVIHYPIFGGPHNRVLRMTPQLASSGWRSFVILPDEEGNAAKRLASCGSTVIPIKLHRFRAKLDVRWAATFVRHFYGDIRRIRQVIRTRRIDLVLVGGLVNPHAAVAARLERVPVVWQIIDSRNIRPVRALIMPLVKRLADAVMFGGQALVDLHLPTNRKGLPVAVCPPAVDSEKFLASAEIRRRTRSSVGIPCDAQVVGMVANLNPQKGIEYFVRAAAIIAKTRPETFFLVVGAVHRTHEQYTAFIHEEIEMTGIPKERFILAGERSDVENYYPAMDVKLITSVPRSEGTTTTSMEAMSCGLPVVAADVGAVKEVVLDRVTGFIVPALNPEALAEATLRLLQDQNLAHRMGANGRQRAVEMFDIKVSLERYLTTFQSAIDHHSDQRADRR